MERPKSEETEEDLLRLQKEFLTSTSSPSAKLIKPGDKRKNISQGVEQEKAGEGDAGTDPGKRDVVNLGGLPVQFGPASQAPPKKVKFKDPGKKPKKTLEEDLDPEELLDRHDTHISKVLTEIMEQDVKHVPVYYPSVPALRGFPVAMHRGADDLQPQDSKSGQKKSIFARQLEKKGLEQYGVTPQVKQRVQEPPRRRKVNPLADVVVESSPTTSTDLSGGSSAVLFREPSMISGQGLGGSNAVAEVRKIHEENVSRLQSMEPDAILREQRELLEMLDPSIVELLRKRHTAVTQGQDIPMQVEADQTPKQDSQKEDKSAVEKTISIDDLPVKPKPEWLHMDKVEPEKLEWMKDLPPPPKPDDQKTGKPARFDFTGQLVHEDEELPTNIGLHHHGNEPERAGYSLEELFQLARSANMQQRVVALNILANVIHNAKTGVFYEAVSKSIFPALIDGGLMFILRWAVDDSMDTALTAAIHCLCNTVCHPHDEAGLDRVFSCYHGHVVGNLCGRKPPADVEADEEPQPPSDSELIQQDIIKGLLNMKLLERLRYLLEVWRPQAPVVLDIIAILQRIARHSAETSYKVIQCPRLMDTVLKEFLPTTWEPLGEISKTAVAHGYPVASALKLVRLLCSAGQNMAATLLSKYDLMTRIGRYLSEDAEHLRLLPGEAWLLQLECWRTWTVLLSYGFTAGSVSGLYPVIGKAVQFISKLDTRSSVEKVNLGAAMLKTIDVMVCLAASATSMHSQYAHKKQEEEEPTSAPAIPELHWSQVTGFIQPITICMTTWLQTFKDNYQSKRFDLTILAGCMDVLSSFLARVQGQPGYEALQTLEDIEQLACALDPVFNILPFNWILSAAREHSVLLWEGKQKRDEELPCLPEMGSVLGNQAELCPALSPANTAPCIIALTRLLLAMAATHKDIPAKLFHKILQNEEVVLYVRKSCQSRVIPNAVNHFAKFDNILHFNLVNMSRFQGVQCDRELYHHCTLSLLSHLQPGDEHLAHHLLSTIVFSSDFISKDSTDMMELERLQVNESEPLQLATMEKVQLTTADLLCDATSHLADIRATYLQAMQTSPQHMQLSRGLYQQHYSDVGSLMVPSCHSGLVPCDWFFMPIVQLYNVTTAKSAGEESISPTIVGHVTHTLRWLYLIHRCRSSLLQPVAFATQYSRLLCIFLAGSDIFLDKWVHAYLAGLLRMYCRSVLLDKAKLDVPIPGLASFYDLYVMLIGQFESVSFGDALFACYVMLPMQQCYSRKFRRAVWGEHGMVLLALRIPVKQMLVPLAGFLEPEETDGELLRLYMQALLAHQVTSKFTPTPYLIAVHHVNRFIYTHSSTLHSLRQLMMKQVIMCKNQELKQHLLYYKQLNTENACGMELYEELPNIRQELLRTYEKPQGDS